jgi:Cu(I)/Ag(I) efflux system membrane fusion protein
MNKPELRILMAIVVAAGSAGLGYWLGTSKHPTTSPAPAAEQARTPLFYRNPMNPEVTSPVPAQDHMGMDYIPVYADKDEVAEVAGTVKIDPVTTQSIGVRTAKAEQRAMSRDIRTVGRIDYDEGKIVRLHPKTEGWIEELFIDETGQSISADEILLNIYSPQLVSSQQEYLLALTNLDKLERSSFPDVREGAKELMENTLTRLQMLDVPEHQIKDLKRTRAVKKHLHIHSPAAGTVINVGARRGQYVTPSTELYFIADLSHVWVFVDVFEEELPWVRVGDSAEMRIQGIPGKAFAGKLTYIYPYAERETRTVKARLEFPNEAGELKPDMFADVTIRAQPKAGVVAVPSEAVVRSGLREKVFLVLAAGKFEPREVTVGVSSEGWTEILDGLMPGEEVVVSAQFLIDSESKLREAVAKMREIDND